MGVTRSSLGRGPAKVMFGGATLFTRDDLVPRHAPVWQPVTASLHGQIDKYKQDLTVKLELNLFGLWQDLQVLFPAALLNPVVGASLLGAADAPLVIHAKNGDRITYHNAAITGLAGLYLGVDAELWSSAVEFTAILKDGAEPGDPAAYFTRDSAAYTETTFARQNFLKERWIGSWIGKTGFNGFGAQKGFGLSWALDVKPVTVDGLGTVDLSIGPGGLAGTCKAIPLGPTLAQIDAAQAVTAAHGVLLSGGAADLAIENGMGTYQVALRQAAITESGTAFGAEVLRVGEVTWETTRRITAGTPEGVGSITEI